MSLGTLLSRFLGLIRDLLIAAFFNRTQTDIFFVAFRLPNFFRRFLGEGAFSASVTPVLVESLSEKNGKAKINQITASLFTLLFLLASLLSLLGVVFMEELMGLFFKGSPYASIEGKLKLTIWAGKIVFAYLFLVAIYSYFMSVAHALGKFFLPALAPALFNLTLIVFALLPQHWWPFPAFSLSLAVIVGGVIQLLLAWFVVRSQNFLPLMRLSFRNPAVVSVLKRFAAAAIGLSGLACISILNVYFAGWLTEGTHTYIYYGDRLLEFPRSLIAVSLGTALVPELARFYSDLKKERFFQLCRHSLDLLLFLTLPCALVFVLLPEPLISMLFERGEFTEEAVRQTVLVLKINAAVLVFSSTARVLVSGFFASNKNWRAAFCQLIYVLFHGVAAWFLTGTYGLKGLVWATALSSGLYLCLLALAFSYFIGPLKLSKRAFVFTKTLPGLFVLAGILKCYPFVLTGFQPLFSVGLAQLLSVLFILSLAGTSYLILGLIFKHPASKEVTELLNKISLRILRR